MYMQIIYYVFFVLGLSRKQISQCSFKGVFIYTMGDIMEERIHSHSEIINYTSSKTNINLGGKTTNHTRSKIIINPCSETIIIINSIISSIASSPSASDLSVSVLLECMPSITVHMISETVCPPSEHSAMSPREH